MEKNVFSIEAMPNEMPSDLKKILRAPFAFIYKRHLNSLYPNVGNDFTLEGVLLDNGGLLIRPINFVDDERWISNQIKYGLPLDVCFVLASILAFAEISADRDSQICNNLVLDLNIYGESSIASYSDFLSKYL